MENQTTYTIIFMVIILLLLARKLILYQDRSMMKHYYIEYSFMRDGIVETREKIIEANTEKEAIKSLDPNHIPIVSYKIYETSSDARL